MILRRMSHDHWILTAAVVLVLALSSVPSMYGFLSAPKGGWWTGILTRNTADVNGYLSIIEEIRQGQYRTRNLFTAEPHAPFQIRPYYTALGLIARMFPAVSNVVVMEVGRVCSATILLVIIALLSCRLFVHTRERMIAFLVLTLASGLGWLNLFPVPLDLGLVETSTFLALLSPPLFTVSLSLIIGIFLCLEKIWNGENEREARRLSLLSGALALWLALDRPFSIATLSIAAVAALLLLAIMRKQVWKQRVFRTLPLFGGISIGLGYQFYMLSHVPIYEQWNRQHVLPTPEPLQLLSAFGLLLPGAIIGIRPFFRANPAMAVLSGSYAIASIVLSHSPIPFQVRFLEGLPFTLALFTCYGLMQLLRRVQSKPLQTTCVTLLLLVLTASSFAAVTLDLEVIARQKPPQYIPKLAVQAMQQLARLATPEEAVLSSESSGNFIVAYAGRPVVLGQRIQTAHYQEKQQLVFRFFHSKATGPRADSLFQKSGATWLFWGPEEAWLAEGVFHPGQAPFLEPKFTNGFVTLYRLR